MSNGITTYRQDSSACYNDEERSLIHSVIENYNTALTLLGDYDYQCMKRPEGQKAINVTTYEECRKIIDMINFKTESELFGNEKYDSFKGSIGNIYQTYGGKDVYPTLEEKTANLLYFVTKNHSFSDGNKRIAAVFLYISFIKILPSTMEMVIKMADNTFVALIMVAESGVEEKEIMIVIIMK